MDRETAEAYFLGTVGVGIGIVKEVKREITGTDNFERLEALTLVGAVGVLAVAGYSVYKTLKGGITS